VKVFPSAKIRNVALVGHSGAGKTTLAEALLHASGAIPRMGRVEDGNTVTDFDPEEHKRGISVSLSLAPVEWEGNKINLLDAPGYADFVGDVAAALAAADLAVFVVSAVEGVEVQTEIAWKLAEQRGIPRAIFVSKLDKERASYSRTLDQLKDRFGAGVAPLQLPIGEEAALSGVVELLNDVAFSYNGSTATGTQGAVPGAMEAEEHSVHDALVEGIVVADDDLMERYLMEEAIESDELVKALAKGIDDGTVYPVLCGSATKLVGVDRLAHFIVEEGPAPHTGSGSGTAAIVFKTTVDPYVGKINLFRVHQGTVKADDHLTDSRTKKDERLHQIFALRGKDQETLAEVQAGDIGAVAKLADVSTGDVLSAPGTTIDVTLPEAPAPALAIAIHAKSKNDEDKLANALHRLQDEDPVLRIERNPETHQTLLWGMGETHVNIALAKLASKFGVEVETDEVRVPYRETIAGTAEAEGKVKKQSGGHGQYAVAWLRVEPQERGAGIEFVDAIVGGVIPRNYLPAVEKGVLDTAEQGGVYGYPIVDVKVTCFDGKAHSVDSSDMAFRTAASVGLKEAMAKAQPCLLEPISELVITVPEANQGDVMGDLNSRRGRIQGSASVGGGEVEITALAPTSEVMRYSIDLRSMTGGRGRYEVRHSHYDPVPAHVADKIKATADAEAAKKS
jgi:elongation factor G